VSWRPVTSVRELERSDAPLAPSRRPAMQGHCRPRRQRLATQAGADWGAPACLSVYHGAWAAHSAHCPCSIWSALCMPQLQLSMQFPKNRTCRNNSSNLWGRGTKKSGIVRVLQDYNLQKRATRKNNPTQEWSRKQANEANMVVDSR